LTYPSWIGRASGPCNDVLMTFDEGLAVRIRDIVADEDGLTEKRMFGGLAMLLHGNMAVGVHGDGLIVRADPASQEALLAEPGARVFDMTGRPMKGWLMVDPEGCGEDDQLRRWVARGVDYARSLPPK
jgi:TfoX/Sxy family transcriptional regulator of competence genes